MYNFFWPINQFNEYCSPACHQYATAYHIRHKNLDYIIE